MLGRHGMMENGGLGFDGARPQYCLLKLRDADDPNGILVLLGGLEPIAVWGPLDPKVGHLALDHAGVGSQPPGWEYLEEDLASGFGVGVSERLRGENPDGTPWSGGPPGGNG